MAGRCSISVVLSVLELAGGCAIGRLTPVPEVSDEAFGRLWRILAPSAACQPACPVDQ